MAGACREAGAGVGSGLAVEVVMAPAGQVKEGAVNTQCSAQGAEAAVGLRVVVVMMAVGLGAGLAKVAMRAGAAVMAAVERQAAVA